jgi:hypothetical protein
MLRADDRPPWLVSLAGLASSPEALIVLLAVLIEAVRRVA